MCTHFMYSTSGREKKTDPYPGTAQCQRGSCSVHSAKQKKEATLKQRKKKKLYLADYWKCVHAHIYSENPDNFFALFPMKFSLLLAGLKISSNFSCQPPQFLL